MENLKIDDFTNYKFLSNLNLSPDGKNCGLIVHEIDVEENSYISNIYNLNENNKIVKLVTLGEEKSFIWKTNKSILFPSIRNEKDKERKKKGEVFTSYYEMPIEGGEPKKAFEIPLNVNDIKKIDDENYLIIAIFNPDYRGFENLSDKEKEIALNQMKEKSDCKIFDEIPFWSNGEGYTNKKRSMLYIYNINSKEIRKITDEFSNVIHYALNSDKNHIVFITSSFIDKMSAYTNLNIYSIDQNKYEKIMPLEKCNYSYCDFLNDNVVFIGSDMRLHGLNQNPNIYITDHTGNFVKKISNSDYSIANSIGSDCTYGDTRNIKVDGNFLYYISTEKSNSFIYQIDINGNTKRLTPPHGSVNDFDIIDEKVYFIGMRGMKLQELYEQNSREVQLTNFNTWVNEEKKLSAPEKLFLQLNNGNLLEGWVLKPVGYEEEKTYAGILDIHGGPKSAYGEIFFHEMQYWANKGYFVFYCNPRGSDGYGDKYADIRGKYGTVDYEDLMNFTDLVLKNYPAIDKDRIGVTGGSYGGFMTNWIIGHTSRFKAAVSQRSISNWISFFGTSDIGYYFASDQISSTPWDNHEKMWSHSPLKYADNIITPTLFINSEEDYRCWIPEGLQMFTALKYHGVDSRLVAFKEENHELSRSGKPKNRIKRLEEITAWFDKYLK